MMQILNIDHLKQDPTTYNGDIGDLLFQTKMGMPNLT